MKDLNKIILIGRLGNDPVRRETKTGLAVTHFSLATSRKVSDGQSEDGEASENQKESREETVWHSVVVWGRQAEVCFQFLRKGRTVYVEGSMRKRTYTSKDGQHRVSFEVHADSVGFLGGLSGSGASQNGEAEAAPAEAAS